jgi:hydrogenase maturation factor
MCVAVSGKIISIGEPSTALVPAEVAFPDRTLDVNLIMVPDAVVGDRVIVHSGYAIRVAREPIGVEPELSPRVQDGPSPRTGARSSEHNARGLEL